MVISQSSILFFFCVLTLAVFPGFSQILDLPDCLDEEEVYTFTGEAKTTLCESFPDFECTIEIGEGTLYPQSSDVGSSISGNVCIVGNFEIDAEFTFTDANVKINSGVSISIANSTEYSASSTLYVDNTKMFACDDLWGGIVLGTYSTIITSNNSKIEDAEKAIFAVGRTRLFIERTTFNRNRIGIELVRPEEDITGPAPVV